MTVWRIMGRYCGSTEEVDEFDTFREARDMVKEYRLAFGAGWSLWVKRGRRQ